MEVINPDHKKEYTHKEMVDLFTEAGLRIVRQHGIGFMPETARAGVFQMEELSASFPSIVDDIEWSYTLAYLVTAD